MFVGEEGERSKLCIVLKANFSVLYIKRCKSSAIVIGASCTYGNASKPLD